MYNLASNLAYCGEIVSGVSRLMLYSHISTAFVFFVVGWFVYSKGREQPLNKILFAISLSFAFWVILNISIWFNYANNNALMFAWSFIEVFAVLLFILTFYFVYIYLTDKKPPIWLNTLATVALLPLIGTIASNMTLRAYDIQECIAIESSMFSSYTMWVKIAIGAGTVLLIAWAYFTKKKQQQLLVVSLGVLAFFASFFVAGLIAESTGNYMFEFYGLFGILFFVAALVNLIIKFKMFDIHLLSSQALVLTLIALIGAILFVAQSNETIIITSVTLVLAIVFGMRLIKSVKKEVEQRERLEQLRLRLEESNIKLEVANDKLKDLDKLKTEFLSLAAHQLRSPLTAIKGYTSMLIDGDFGKIGTKQKEAVTRVFESSNHLSKVVEDLLNVSKIEAGGMKYEMVPFDIEKEAGDLARDLSVTAKNKGINLTFKTDGKSPYTVNGDLEKIRQVILNIVDNAIKYTEKGSITVSLGKDVEAGLIKIDVTDTGMGISAEEKEKLFQKFSRGAGGKINTGGSGLGLYLAKTIAEAHGGSITIDSPGVGLGSTFSIDFKAA